MILTDDTVRSSGNVRDDDWAVRAGRLDTSGEDLNGKTQVGRVKTDGLQGTVLDTGDIPVDGDVVADDPGRVSGRVGDGVGGRGRDHLADDVELITGPGHTVVSRDCRHSRQNERSKH